jgi:PPP family 3-phenylpropionic acid transporter
MRALKAQYFCGFAVMGSVVPYASVFLTQRGLSETQLGIVLATIGVAICISPVLITLLADAAFESRNLLAMTFGLALAALLGLWLSHSFWALFITHAAFALGFWPLLPLQDGLNFAMRRHRVDAGQRDVPYHHIRVWGTLGFIVPSLGLFFFLQQNWPIGVVLWSGMVFCLVGIIVTRFLPHVRQPKSREDESPSTHDQEAGEEDEPASLDPPEKRSRLPTIDAARRMMRPRMLMFSLGMWLIHLAAAAYYAYYPRYLTDANLIALGDQWLGLIANFGVVIEIFFMLSFGWFVRSIGLRGLMSLGALAFAVRLGLLFFFPTVTAAVGSQLLHGINVLVLHVAPPVFINHHAEARFRNSMQGVYAMTVFGTGRVTGNVLAGLVAELSVLAVFAYGAVLCLIAMPLFYFAFQGDEATVEP